MNTKFIGKGDYIDSPADNEPLRISQKTLDEWDRLKNMQTTPIHFDHKSFLEILLPWLRNWRYEVDNVRSM